MNGHVTKRAKIMEKLGVWSATHRKSVLFIILAVTLVMGTGFLIIDFEMTFYSIMPRESQQVKDLEHITEAFPFASNIIIVVDGRSIADPDTAQENVRYAVDALTSEFSEDDYDTWLTGVYGTFESDFFKTHGLMLSDTETLEGITGMYRDPQPDLLLQNINNALERGGIGSPESPVTDTIALVSQLEGLEELLKCFEIVAAGGEFSGDHLQKLTDSLLFGPSYMMNREGTMALVFLLPTFSMNDISVIVRAIPAIEDKAEQIASLYGCEAGLTGMPVVAKDEMVTSEQGLIISMLVAIILILVLLILVFRMPPIPLITGIPLLIGIFWTLGITGLTLQRLNLMTAMYVIALLGLGIDYAIHILTTYIQERDGGCSFLDAVRIAYLKTGPGILTGAITTSATFFVLMISKTEIMRELGFVAGCGILCEFVAMVLILPALLNKRYDRLSRKGKNDLATFGKLNIRADLASKVGVLVKRSPVIIVTVFMASGLIIASRAGSVQLEDNIMKMEAKGLKSIELQEEMVKEFDMAPDGIYILSKDPAEVKRLTEELEMLDSVQQVESIGQYVVSDEEYRKRRNIIEEYRRALQDKNTEYHFSKERFLEELYRLKTNLLKMQEFLLTSGLDSIAEKLEVLTGRNNEGQEVGETVLDKLIALLKTKRAAGYRLAEFISKVTPLLEEKLLAMTSTERITRDMLPDMVKNSYIPNDGEEYLITVLPRQNPWEGDFREKFSEEVSRVTDKATGMIFAADQLNHMAETDGIRALILAVVTISMLLFLDFRNLKMVFLNIVPLALSIGSLIGLMALTGIKFDFANIIALPLLIGIGIDDSVHISHRYLYEGKEHIDRVVAKTGSAVVLTSLTTIIGFGSFIPSVMRALRSTGVVLSIAMALACIFSVVMYPAMLLIVREKMGIQLVQVHGRAQ